MIDTLIPSVATPNDCCFLPDGRVLVANSAGSVTLFAGGPVATIGTVPSVESGGERGLLSIAADPGFAQNGQGRGKAHGDGGDQGGIGEGEHRADVGPEPAADRPSIWSLPIAEVGRAGLPTWRVAVCRLAGPRAGHRRNAGYPAVSPHGACSPGATCLRL